MSVVWICRSAIVLSPMPVLYESCNEREGRLVLCTVLIYFHGMCFVLIADAWHLDCSPQSDYMIVLTVELSFACSLSGAETCDIGEIRVWKKYTIPRCDSLERRGCLPHYDDDPSASARWWHQLRISVSPGDLASTQRDAFPRTSLPSGARLHPLPGLRTDLTWSTRRRIYH